MTFHEYLAKARQDDAQRAGQRDRLILTARQAPRHGGTAPVLPPGHGAWPG